MNSCSCLKPGDGYDLVRVPYLSSSAVLMSLEEVVRQDEIHPDGFPATRDGLRLGLAAMQDELEETVKAHHDDRRSAIGVAVGPDFRRSMEGELVQTIAIGLRMLRSLHDAAGPARGEW